LENCDVNVDMNAAWGNIRENIKTPANEPRALPVTAA
jgi:hypothetical protein